MPTAALGALCGGSALLLGALSLLPNESSSSEYSSLLLLDDSPLLEPAAGGVGFGDAAACAACAAAAFGGCAGCSAADAGCIVVAAGCAAAAAAASAVEPVAGVGAAVVFRRLPAGFSADASAEAAAHGAVSADCCLRLRLYAAAAGCGAVVAAVAAVLSGAAADAGRAMAAGFCFGVSFPPPVLAARDSCCGFPTLAGADCAALAAAADCADADCDALRAPFGPSLAAGSAVAGVAAEAPFAACWPPCPAAAGCAAGDCSSSLPLLPLLVELPLLPSVLLLLPCSAPEAAAAAAADASVTGGSRCSGGSP